MPAILKVINSRMLQKTVNYAPHIDSLAESLNAGTQAANTAHDQIDVHADL
ncbi:hypothetical protein D3C76_1669650 [compost metagenome]